MFKYWKTEDGKGAYFTRGCAHNAEEANRIVHELKPYFDRYIVVNSCILKEKQERSLLACLQALIDRSPKDTKVFITGCSATLNPENYEKYGKVIPNKDKFNLQAYGVPADKCAGPMVFPQAEVAMIEIQEGCNSSCTYCIIPKARGKSRSTPYNVIADRIRVALNQGHKIIRFVGTNLTQYVRQEDDGKIYRLSDLCNRILNDFPEIELLQTDFIEPESSEVERMLEVMEHQPRLEKRLDLGIQSFCDEILIRMNRRTRKERLHNLYVKYGHKANLLADIIVGFPGETEEQFQENCEFIKTHHVIDAHIHCFSGRPGTPAYDMPDQISEEEKNRRANILRMLVFENSQRAQKDPAGLGNPNKKRRIVQFELTKQCNNGCTFCYNWPDTLNKEEDKVATLLDVHAFVNSDEMLKYDGVGIIGGELFDGQYTTYIEKLLFAELFPVILYNLRFKDSELRIASALMMEDPTFLIHSLRGEHMSAVTNFNTIRLCTSYDTMGRFTTPHKLELWEHNIKLIHDTFPAIKLHTEIIVTEDFLQKVLSGEFNITEFKNKYHTEVDFIEPNSGFHYKDKKEFSKHVPNFFPKRSTFLKFLHKMVETHEVNLHDLFDTTQKADTLFMRVNGKMQTVTDRMAGGGDLPCNIPSKCGYIDSDISMRDDVLSVLEEL